MKKKLSKPPYLDRIDELEHLSIVRLKGNIDSQMVPVIEARIKYNRKHGSKIDKNVLVDYRQVEEVDSAGIAFHLMRLKEYEAKGFSIGFINASDKLKSMLDMFKQSNTFKMYASEDDAVRELNRG